MDSSMKAFNNNPDSLPLTNGWQNNVFWSHTHTHSHSAVRQEWLCLLESKCHRHLSACPLSACWVWSVSESANVSTHFVNKTQHNMQHTLTQCLTMDGSRKFKTCWCLSELSILSPINKCDWWAEEKLMFSQITSFGCDYCAIGSNTSWINE